MNGRDWDEGCGHGAMCPYGELVHGGRELFPQTASRSGLENYSRACVNVFRTLVESAGFTARTLDGQPTLPITKSPAWWLA